MINKIKNLLNSQPDILNGKIWKSLVLLSLPIIISNLFQTFYNITDAFWLGKLGKTALAAPTITFSTIFTIIAMASGLAVGGTTLVGQYKGAGKEDKVREVAGNTFTLVFIIAIILSVCGLIFSEDILKLLKTPDDAFVQTLQYMRVIVSGIPFIFSFYVFQGVLQGYGNTVSPMKISAFTVIINLVLDPILIFGLGPIPKMGVIGAGLATLFSQLLASVIGVTFLFTGKYGIRLHIRDLKPKLKSIKNILKIGLPVSFAHTGTALGFTVLMVLVNTLGSGVVSAFGVGNRIISILVMPAMGLANGNAIMVAQNIGANNVKRAEKTVWTAVAINSVLLLIFTTLLFFFGKYVIQFFINDPEVIAIGSRMFRITAYSVLFFSIMIIFSGAFQGSGHTVPVFVLHISRLWLFRVPFAYLFVNYFHMEHDGIFWAMFISNSVITLISFIWFKTGSWKKMIIKNTKKISDNIEIINN